MNPRSKAVLRPAGRLHENPSGITHSGGVSVPSLSPPSAALARRAPLRILVAMRAYATILPGLRSTLCVGACLLLTVPVYAVQPYTPVHPDPMLESWRWRTYPELKGRGLQCMAEDRDGNMWFGVDGGVVRYDGVDWVTYTIDDGLVGGQVNAICGTRKGDVYVGTGEGLSRFRDGSWERIFPKNDVSLDIGRIVEAADGSIWATTGWAALQVREGSVSILTDGGSAAWVRVHWPSMDVSVVPDEAILHSPWPDYNHWGARVGQRVVFAVAEGGPADAAGIMPGDRIVAIEGDSSDDWSRVDSIGTSVRMTVERVGVSDPFEVILVPTEVIGGRFSEFVSSGVYEDREGNLWFANAVAVVRYSTKSTWQLYTSEDWTGRGGARVLQTRDGLIWVASRDGTQPLRRFDGDSWSSIRLGELGGNDSNESLFESQDGTLWVGSHSNLAAYRDGNWQHYRYPEIPLPRTRVRDILQAQDGAFWLASLGQGALRLDISDDRWMTLEGLSFGCETRDRSLWFISADSGVVLYDGRRWMRYGVEDGLMDLPTALLATRDGGLWAAGSQDSTAATARFEGSRWVLETHAELSWSVGKSVFEAMDGSLWFGAGNSPSQERGETGGLMQYDGATWHHHGGPSGAPRTVYGIGQISENALWADSYSLRRYDGHTWTRIDDPPEFANTWVDAIHSDRKAGLWVGTRAYGVFHYNGQSWARYGLGGTRVGSLASLNDGSVLAATDEGISRFDGSTWTSRALPAIEATRHVELKTSSDGSLWINSRPLSNGEERKRTVRYRPESIAPQTGLTLSATVVSQPGNTTLAWEGADPWKATPNEEIKYAHRLDEGDWSAFSHKTSHIFQALSSGDHTFEVKARDRDFNEDATPAMASFTVVPPVWQQGWFIGMVIVFVGGIGFQTSRVIRRDRRLREGNEALSAANNELFQVNRDLESVNVDLQREQVLERLRGQAQGMQSSEDIGSVVEAVYGELSGLGLPVAGSAIYTFTSETEQEIWSVDEDGSAFDARILDRPLDHPATEARRRGDDYYHGHVEGEEVKEYVHRIIERGGGSRWKSVPEERWPRKMDSYFIFFDGGGVIVGSEEPIAEEYLMLIKRFGEVFGYAHSRHKELQEKEAQNRRLMVEASLEHVRARALGMQESADIGEVAKVLFAEMANLGIEAPRSAITVNDIVADTTTNWWGGQGGTGRFLSERGGRTARVHLSEFDSSWVEAWRQGEASYHLVKRTREEVVGREGATQVVSEMSEAERTAYFDLFEHGQRHYFFFFKQGWVSPVLTRELSEDEIHIGEQLAQAFGLAYSRFDELQLKEAQNRRLAVEASVQRLRAEVQTMDEASDFERILSLLTESLKTVELAFDGCEIDVLDEPVENPTMELFEANGFKYATYTLDTDGHVAVEAFAVAAPFPGVIRQTVERFIAGEPWQAVVGGNESILEVPAGSYGRLRLTASEHGEFTDDEVATLREFADAVALGYARYLDIREIQLNTERKSEFLASMSHELRTPMNAIKGFANLLARREPNLTDRGKENLAKVNQASDHLLTMIDDLLDLSKIQAGRMDVNPDRFDVGELVTSACDTVSPLIQEGVELRHDVADDIGEAITDKARVQQMVINLLSNAIKFTEAGNVTVSAATEDGALVIAVSDSGKGIPAEELPTIFDEYRQAEGSESAVQKGTGLGLSITKKFAELLGGTIGVESEAGKGSTFTVRVPLEYGTGG